MAFSGRFGGIMRQIISQNTAVNGQASVVSMLNAARCMSTKLFIGGLSYGTDDQSLRDAFSSFGDVTEAKVITDRDTGRSRGFGFVNFANEECASSALSSMDGQELHGRSIRVSVANDRPRPSFGGGGGGGCGGYQSSFGGGFSSGGRDDGF